MVVVVIEQEAAGGEEPLGGQWQITKTTGNKKQQKELNKQLRLKGSTSS